MPVSPELLALLDGVVPPDAVRGYLVVLDLTEESPGEHRIAVEVTACDGQRARREGRVRLEPAERYGRWAKLGERSARVISEQQPSRAKVYVGVLAAPGGDPVPLHASLNDQSCPRWDLQTVESLGEMLARFARDRAEDDVLLLTAANVELRPYALELITGRLAGPDRPDLVYWDEELLDASGTPTGARLKPGWSPELLLQHDYIGPAVALRPRAARTALGNDAAPETVYEMLLALVDTQLAVERIPHILTARPIATGPSQTDPTQTDPTQTDPAPADAGRALEAVARRRRRSVTIEDPGDPGHGPRRLRWPLPSHPPVSIVIPTSGQTRWLEPCLLSLRHTTSYDALEVVLVHSGPGPLDPLLTRILAGIDHLVVPYASDTPRDGFNFSHASNLGAARGRGDYVLFLNDDVEAIDPDWLVRMVEQASLPGVGVVGARLEWPEGLVQHCGMALRGLGHGPPGNTYETFAGFEPSSPGPEGLLRYTHECAAVTGACLMTPRNLLRELGGWDVRFPLDFGDVDLCLRSWTAGQRVLVMPSVSLRHHQSATREFLASHEGLHRFQRRWLRRFASGDRWHHPAYDALRDGVLALPNDCF